jgi:hypothetical protein
LEGRDFSASVKVDNGGKVVVEQAKYWNGYTAGTGTMGIPR